MILSKFLLTDRVAVVTGAGRGIGKAIALGLAEAGANIVATARTSAEIEVTASQVRAMGRRAIAVPTDVRDSQQVQQMMDKAVAEFGQIDILVNNAGGFIPKPFAEMSEKNWENGLRENLTSCFLCTQAVLKHMVAQNKGAVLNISSAAGRLGIEGGAQYGAAKAGMINLTATLGWELSKHNIRVNCIAVGPVGQEGPGREVMESRQDMVVSGVVTHRFGKPDDIAAAALYLVSDAAEWVTGKTFEIDGGLRFLTSLI